MIVIDIINTYGDGENLHFGNGASFYLPEAAACAENIDTQSGTGDDFVYLEAGGDGSGDGLFCSMNFVNG